MCIRDRAGTPCSLTAKGSDYLYMGGYCMETTGGQLMVPAAVAKAYEHINTEKFHKRRRLVYRVWSYMNAAIYLYGICRPEQITALYNLHESDVLPEPELHEMCIRDRTCSFPEARAIIFSEIVYPIPVSSPYIT